MFYRSQCNAFYQMRPLLRVTGQQFLVLQVLLMENRMCKMLLIPGAIFCAHFQGVKNMDLGTGYMDLIRQRSDKIGIELIFTALHGHIRAGIAKHFQKSHMPVSYILLYYPWDRNIKLFFFLYNPIIYVFSHFDLATQNQVP